MVRNSLLRGFFCVKMGNLSNSRRVCKLSLDRIVMFSAVYVYGC